MGVSPDGPEEQKAFIDKFSFSFPLLSDPDRSMMKDYGAFGEKVIRSSVWIGTDGTVKKHWAKVTDAAGHPDEVLEAIRGAQ